MAKEIKERIDFKGLFVMDKFETDDKKQQEYFVCKLVDPFPDLPMDLEEVRLMAKWDKYNDQGKLVKADALFAQLKSCARYALRKTDKVEFSAYAKVVVSNRGEKFPALFIKPPFVAMEDERDVEVTVKGAEASALFFSIVRKQLGFNVRPDDPEDAGLI